jgi:hypothetical protein
MNILIDDCDIPQSKVTKATKLIKKALPYLKKEFSFPKNAEILLQYRERNIEGTITLGEVYKYPSGKYACVINLNNKGHSLLDTLGHEFTHIEQMYQCRLAKTAHCFHWMEADKTIKRVDKATTFEEYRNYPWEIEARKRGRDFNKKYRAVIDPTIKDRLKKLFGLI